MPRKRALKAGDVIEYVEGKASRDISLYDAKQLIAGEPGTAVNLRVLRSGEKPSEHPRNARGTYKTPQVETKVEAGKVGVIKVFQPRSRRSERHQECRSDP